MIPLLVGRLLSPRSARDMRFARNDSVGRRLLSPRSAPPRFARGRRGKRGRHAEMADRTRGSQ